MNERSRRILVLVAISIVAISCSAVPADTTATPTTSGNGASGWSAPDKALAETLAGTNKEFYSAEEVVLLTAVCLEEKGFPVTVQGSAMLYWTPPSQEAAYEEATTVCSAEVDARYPEAPPPSPRKQYDSLVEVAECMRSEGYDLPETPTYDAWLDNRFNVDSWDPNNSVARLPFDELYQLNEVCHNMGFMGEAHLP